MKTLISALFLTLFPTVINAQATDSLAFKTRLYNKEFQLSLYINLHEKNITVPEHDYYGPLPGYLSRERYQFCWPIVDAETDGDQAVLTLVNDYGSEDLTATLTRENDTTYVFRHRQGSALKMPNNGKWQKMPKTLVFLRRKL